jgi:ERCC4-type nuclease
LILIDEREGSNLLTSFIHPDCCEKTRLDFDVDGSGKLVACGDAMLVGNGPTGSISVGIELKSVSDALSSISTGRLGGTQIPRMLKVYDCIFLLIFGLCRPGADNYLEVRKGKAWKRYHVGRRPVPWSFFEGFLLTARLTAFFSGKPLFVKQVYDLEEAGIWLMVLDRWLSKKWSKHRGLAVFDKSRVLSAPPDADPVEVQIATTAASFPAVDWVRGFNAARHFDSVSDMINASVQDWMEVDNIGPVIARETVRAINRRKR